MVPSSETDCSVFPAPGVVELPYGLYPGLAKFRESCTDADYCSWMEQSNGDPLPAPVAIYVQDVPHPGALTQPHSERSRHLAAIEQELRIVGARVDADRPVKQFICSGNIASQWTDDQLYSLVETLQESLCITQSGLANWCACLGSMVPDRERLRLLRILGFSGIRLALFDHTDDVGVLDQLRRIIAHARDYGMGLIAIDVVHDPARGQGLSAAMQQLMRDIRPDRVRLVACIDGHYAAAVDILGELGYQPLGQDWFVLAGDRWLQAKQEGRLYWSMLGFTEMSSPDVLGIGPGALSSVGEFYARNTADWDTYQARLAQGSLPIVSGLELESDDVLRREIMNSILAASVIRPRAIENKWGIRFDAFFASEMERIRQLEQRQWLKTGPDEIAVSARSWKELTEICRVFDKNAGLEPVRPELSLV